MIVLQPISLYDLITLIVSAAGFIAVIISIHLLNKSLQSSTFEAGRGHLFDFNQIFITYPELRPYFYSRKEISEDDPNYERVMAMAENFQDFMDSVLMQRKRFPQVWPKSWWLPYFKYIFVNSPALCRSLESTSDWYQKELIDLMNEAKSLKQKSVQEGVALCNVSPATKEVLAEFRE